MEITQHCWTRQGGWTPQVGDDSPGRHQLVLIFGATEVLRDGVPLLALRAAYPEAAIVGCSTAGEILGTQVLDDSIVATAVHFAHSEIRTALVRLEPDTGSTAAAKQLAAQFPQEIPSPNATGLVPLQHVLVLSDGLHVNGSDLVLGLSENLPPSVSLTGGLAGDGARFGDTLVVWEGRAESRALVGVGFYGRRLRIGFGSLGGWDPFGPERLVTRSRGNVVFEFDGRSALGLYKEYLGEHAAGLPATGLLFPLSLRAIPGETPVVRTILAVDEAEQSMTFAGDVPEGAYARLMKANFDRLIDGATGAARTSHEAIGTVTPDLAILISCVGRKLVLKQRIEEEVEGVHDVLGAGAAMTGFYSYGEISPFTPGARCELHNQTMTITTLSER